MPLNQGWRYNTGRRYNQGTPRPLPDVTGITYPVLLTETLHIDALLSEAYDFTVTRELRGQDTLSFRIRAAAPGASSLTHLGLVAFETDYYRITRFDESMSGDTRMFEVEAQARWWELASAPLIEAQSFATVPAAAMLSVVLQGTGWAVGLVTTNISRSFEMERTCDRLGVLRSIETLYAAEIEWDTRRRVVSLHPRGGTDRGAHFLRRKNIVGLELDADSSEIVHRMVLYGKDDIGPVTVSVPSPFDPPPTALVEDDRFLHIDHLRAYGEEWLATRSEPVLSWALGIVDFGGDDAIALGDVVTIYDDEMGHHLSARIVKLTIRPQEPERTEIEISTTRRHLAAAIMAAR